MSRARILADYVSSGDELALKAPLASPTFTGTIGGGAIGSAVTFPTGHCIQIVSHTDSTQRTIASPTGTACEGVQKAITSTVANSNFYISGGISIKQTGSHGGSGIFLGGLTIASNLVLSNGHADSSGSGNGWHGWRVSHETNNIYHVCPHHSCFYDVGTHSVGTTFTFYLGAMGYYQNGQVMTNVDGGYSGREGKSNITIMEIAP